MTPEQKLKHLILLNEYSGFSGRVPEGVDAEAIDALWAEFTDAEEDSDARNEIRGGTVETGLKSEYSRHYESKAVATQYLDGSWIGWTYWYGGGKHGQPEEMDWIEYAYDLDCVEEVKLVTVRTFTPPAAQGPAA